MLYPTRYIALFLIAVTALGITTRSNAITSGPYSPNSVAQGGGTLTWSNPTRIYSANNQTASAYGSVSGGLTNVLNASNFNMNIPANAIIEGITLQIKRRRTSSSVLDYSIRLHNGTSYGSNQSSGANWSTTDAYVSFGGATSLWGLGPISPAQVNSSVFNVNIQASVFSSATALIDHVQLYIHYSLHLPTASNVLISPANAFSTNDLTLSYTYNDDEGHPEGSTIFRWYKDNIYQPAFDNLLTINSAFTTKGQGWGVIVQPNDGITYGNLFPSSLKVIANSVPYADNATLAPEFPTTSDDLTTSHFYFDADIDPETTPEVRWYKEGVNDPLYDDLITLPAEATTKGDTWFYTLRPNDGEDLGAQIVSPPRTILNSAPIASELTMYPASPNTTDTLSVSWTFFDADSDPSVGTQIRWFLNNVLQPQFNSTIFISSSNTSRGQQWHFTILPNDGTEPGVLQTSPTTTIVNAPPTARNVKLVLTNRNDVPSPPTTDLELSYTYHDIENDPETGTTIRWYKSSVLQPAYNNVLSITGVDLTGDSWYATVTPNDGIDVGQSTNSNWVSTAPNLPLTQWILLMLISTFILGLGIYRLTSTR